MVEDVVIPLDQPMAAAQQPSRPIGRGPGRAEKTPPGAAVGAVSAGRQEGQHHLVAGREAAVGVGRLDHRRRRLVAQGHGGRARPVAVHHRQVGVAQARRIDANQQLARARRAQLQLGQAQGPRLGIGPDGADLVQHGRGDLHGVSSRQVCRWVGVGWVAKIY